MSNPNREASPVYQEMKKQYANSHYERILKIREIENLSQEDLATKIGTSEKTLSNIGTKKRFLAPEIALSLHDELSWTLDYIYGVSKKYEDKENAKVKYENIKACIEDKFLVDIREVFKNITIVEDFLKNIDSSVIAPDFSLYPFLNCLMFSIDDNYYEYFKSISLAENIKNNKQYEKNPDHYNNLIDKAQEKYINNKEKSDPKDFIMIPKEELLDVLKDKAKQEQYTEYLIKLIKEHSVPEVEYESNEPSDPDTSFDEEIIKLQKKRIKINLNTKKRPD